MRFSPSGGFIDESIRKMKYSPHFFCRFDFLASCFNMENLYFYPYPHAKEADFQEHHPPSTWGTARVDSEEHLEQGPEEWWDAHWNEHVDQPGNDTFITVQEHDLATPYLAPNQKIK